MEAQLEKAVAAFKGQMGVAAIDVRTGETIAVNADIRFPTASTIKTAVMVEAWHQVQGRRLSMDTTLTLEEAAKVGGSGVLRGLHAGLPLTIADLIHLMIVLSDNTATNMLIGRLGTAHVNERLDAYGLKETKLFRPTFRDGHPDVLPDLEREFGLGMTTPRDMARLMVLIASGKAVSKEASAAMLATLRRQQDRAMIPRLIQNEDGVEIGNKTGTDEEKHALADGVKRHVRADAAIVRERTSRTRSRSTRGRSRIGDGESITTRSRPAPASRERSSTTFPNRARTACASRLRGSAASVCDRGRRRSR